MLKDRVSLCKKINNAIKENGRSYKAIKELANKMNMPIEVAIDYLNMHNHVEDATDQQLYSLAVCLLNKSDYEGYFTENEIKTFKKPYKDNKISLPIRWNMIEIAEDQWIGKITVQELMQLRNAQMINYNPETQRPAKYINDVARIDINRRSVREIEELLLNNSYVPNTLTLNIPIDAEYEYEDGELTIKQIKMFDILDGYHRYISISDLYNLDPNFTYDMELRVVAFSESKAKQFIYQENQKNKIKKTAIEGFNQNSYAVQVVKLLNEEPLLRGVFNAGGQIDGALVARMLNLFVFENRKKYSRKEVFEVKNDLLKKFEKILSISPDMLDKKWSTTHIIYMFYHFYSSNTNQIPIDFQFEVKKWSDNKEIKRIMVESFDKPRLNKLDKLVKEV